MAHCARVHRVCNLFSRANGRVGHNGGEGCRDVGINIGGEDLDPLPYPERLGVGFAAIQGAEVDVGEGHVPTGIELGEGEPNGPHAAPEVEDFSAKIGLGDGFQQQSAPIVEAILAEDPSVAFQGEGFAEQLIAEGDVFMGQGLDVIEILGHFSSTP